MRIDVVRLPIGISQAEWREMMMGVLIWSGGEISRAGLCKAV